MSAETQIRVKTSDILPGDFLDFIERATLTGPRGGKYRYDGLKVQSRVVKCGWRDEFEKRRGFAIWPSTGPGFTVPGNAADLTVAVVRRSVEASSLRFAEDADLLTAAESSDRALKLAALAEIERRTS